MANVAVITGAYRGLGLETARQLALKGYHVVVTARYRKKAEAAATKLAAEKLSAEGQQLDVTDEKSVHEFAGWLKHKYGSLTVLVNNAGVFPGLNSPPPVQQYPTGGLTPSLSASLEQLREGMEANAFGSFNVIKALAPLMKTDGSGRIVNVSSGMGQLSEMNGGYPGYRLSKTALNALTKLLSEELAPHKIKINSVCPGWVRTEMGGANATRAVPEGASGIVWAATLPGDGPTGGFFRDGKPLAW